MTIVASTGSILARPSGGVLATDCGGFTCSSAGIVGCAGCSCCGSRYYQVCISGASGDCAVINSGASGWTLDSGGSGGSYLYDDGQVRITLELSTGTWEDPFFGTITGRGCGDWQLRAYRNDGGVWVECLSAGGTAEQWTALDDNCSVAVTVGDVSYKVRPAERWFPQTLRLTISGHTRCAPTCTQQPDGNYRYLVNDVQLDGVYDVPLDEVSAAGTCTWRLSGVGSYSYSVWTGGDCSGDPAVTVAGAHDIVISLDSGGQLRLRIVQDSSPAAAPGDEFHAVRELGACDCVTLAETGLANYDNRCLAYGQWDASYVRCGHDATATVEALP